MQKIFKNVFSIITETHSMSTTNFFKISSFFYRCYIFCMEMDVADTSVIGETQYCPLSQLIKSLEGSSLLHVFILCPLVLLPFSLPNITTTLQRKIG